MSANVYLPNDEGFYLCFLLGVFFGAFAYGYAGMGTAPGIGWHDERRGAELGRTL